MTRSIVDHTLKIGTTKVKKIYFGIPVLLTAIFSSMLCAQASTGSDAPPVVEIKVTARQYEFEPKTITVQQGQRVKLIVTSVDVDHGFAIRELGIDEKIKANQTKAIEFTASKAGRFRFYCSIYCGEGHTEMVGNLIVTEATTQTPAAPNMQQAPAASNMQVKFDESTPGVVFVESGGERIRIDTSTKIVTRLSAQPAAPNAPATEVQQPTVATVVEPQTRRTSEPYDYRVVNIPTPKRVVRGSLNLNFTHRFSEPVRPFRQSTRDLLGLDSFSVSSLGLSYGITDRLYVNAYRSPICQPGLCKTIEIGLGYHLLDEAGRSPVALNTYASIEGDNNFGKNYTYNMQAMLARSVTKYVNVFFSPAVHFNANGQRRFNPRPENFFPPALIANQFHLDKHAASFGFGVNARIRPTTSLLFEYTPRVGFKLGNVVPIFDARFRVIGFRNVSEAALGFGVEKRIGRHSFSLTFSNTQTTTTSRYNSSNLALPPDKFIIGFNLYRRFLK